MTGAEHYARAEQLLADADADLTQDYEVAAEMRQAAQVHATLALTQATLATFEAADWDRKEP